ncbi:MAG: 50S ribosomal protein L22 [bacterium]|nr:50S ribosomal protein L22 [bacterium]
MEVAAKARFQRGSVRKVRLLLQPLRGMQAEQAIQQLRLAPQAAARPLSKLIASAVANAEHNYSLDKKRLVIDRINADQGPSYKRYRPAARGRAHGIKRQSFHMAVTLRDLPEAGGKPAKAAPKKRTTAAKTAVKKTVAKAAPKRSSKTTTGPEAAKPKDQAPKRQVAPRSGQPVTHRKSEKGTGRGKGD